MSKQTLSVFIDSVTAQPDYARIMISVGIWEDERCQGSRPILSRTVRVPIPDVEQCEGDQWIIDALRTVLGIANLHVGISRDQSIRETYAQPDEA